MGELPTDLREIHSIGTETREWVISGTTSPTLAAARIELCGVSFARSGFSFVRHGWERSQFFLCLAQGGTCWVDGAWRKLATGEGYLTPPGSTHAYRCLPGREWPVVWAILVEPEDAPRLVTTDRPMIISGDGRPLRDAILNLHREMLGAVDPALTRLWADVIVALVRRQLAPGRTDQRLWRLWEEVDSDLGRPWTLIDLARHAGVSAEQLRRLCISNLGTSPMRQLTNLRMRRAAALLASGGRTVATVAVTVGYDNAFAFSTAFRRHHGVPPSRLQG